ncbi:hypothetical protein ACB092_01G248600 [Castanea dentata]
MTRSSGKWEPSGSNPPSTLNPNVGAGHIEQLGGLSTYISSSPNSKLAILLVSAIFCTYTYLQISLTLHFKLKLAYKVAAAGFYVVVPDFFHGDCFVLDDANRPKEVWLKDHGPDKGFAEAKPAVEAVKSKGFSAVGAVGVELAKAELIQADVLLHPSFVPIDDIKGVKVPIAILGAELDQFSPPELLKQFEEVLDAKSEVQSASISILYNIWTSAINPFL